MDICLDIHTDIGIGMGIGMHVNTGIGIGLCIGVDTAAPPRHLQLEQRGGPCGLGLCREQQSGEALLGRREVISRPGDRHVGRRGELRVSDLDN